MLLAKLNSKFELVKCLLQFFRPYISKSNTVIALVARQAVVQGDPGSIPGLSRCFYLLKVLGGTMEPRTIKLACPSILLPTNNNVETFLSCLC